eukprot:7390686-Prymnesium_polylepis.1
MRAPPVRRRCREVAVPVGAHGRWCARSGRPQRRRPSVLLCALCTVDVVGCVGRVCAVRDGVWCVPRRVLVASGVSRAPVVLCSRGCYGTCGVGRLVLSETCQGSRRQRLHAGPGSGLATVQRPELHRGVLATPWGVV